MKCVQCNQRKGKRFCPANNSDICPQCCGEKRVVEIRCPSNCQFLKSGQSYHWLKKYVNMLRALEDPSRRTRLYETSQRFHELLSKIEEVIVEYAASLSSITDRDVHEAIVSLRSTYRTEEKGVIYEHVSANPLAQGLVKELRNFLESYRAASSDEGVSLRTGDLIDCLDFLDVDVSYHLAHDPARDAYLRFVRRSHPELAANHDRSGIILAP